MQYNIQMIGAKLGKFLDRPLQGAAKKIGISPNALTVSGFLVTTAGAVISMENLISGGLIIALGGLFDLFDGIVARTTQKASRFGAFLDSTLDRYSDVFIFTSVAIYLFRGQDPTGSLLCIGAMTGALLTSYTRARAEAAGIDCNVGILERAERIIILVIGMISGYIKPALWIILVLSNLTAVQRIFHSRRTLK